MHAPQSLPAYPAPVKHINIWILMAPECFYFDSLKPACENALTGNIYYSHTLEDKRV